MANDISKVQLPLSVVTEVVKKAKDASTIAALCPSKPKLFADDKHLVFNPTAEAEVVAEGAKKGSYEIDLNPIEGKRFKVVTTTRVSDELKWADEDNKLEIVSNIIDDQGLSPHARGARTTGGSALPLPGIIPACAGSTPRRCRALCRPRDHPRMRGEHARGGETCPRLRGSSPHARGAPVETLKNGRRPRFLTRARVHIRILPHRGMAERQTRQGSSLHARGAPADIMEAWGVVGIIPACAGSTQRCHGARQGVRDHPRMRGKHASAATDDLIPAGSSPHARGAHPARHEPRALRGIISACAGSTRTW